MVSFGDQEQISRFIQQALQEDKFKDDITTSLVIPAGLITEAVIEARQEGIPAGLDICRQVFTAVDHKLDIRLFCKDGDSVRTGDIVARIRGSAWSILRAERTALNILGWMSGIATLTRQFVEQVKGSGALICDTRKTTPTLRMFEKYAVRAGGGHNHRMNLADGVLIKDNHLNVLRATGKTLGEAAALARNSAPEGIKVEVEVTSYEEALEVAAAGVDVILLDNMAAAEMKRVAEALSGRVKLEASGGITLENVAEVGATGVDYISIGALTHSAKNMDFSLEIASY